MMLKTKDKHHTKTTGMCPDKPETVTSIFSPPLGN